MKRDKANLGTDHAVRNIKPNVIIYVGIAGALKDLKIGDVIAVEKAYDYDGIKIEKGDKVSARPEAGYSSNALYERATFETRRDDWKEKIIGTHEKSSIKAKYGAVASGSVLIEEIDSKLVRFLKKHYNDSLAVEMEGNAFFNALREHNIKIEALLVRSISDKLSNKSKTDSKGYQVIAAKNASAFAYEVLSKIKIK